MEKYNKLVNYAIELLDFDHGQEVKKFFKSIGGNKNGMGFTLNKNDGEDYRFYVMDGNGFVDNLTENYCNNHGYKIITLEEAKRIVGDDSFNIPLTKIVGRVVI